MVVGATKFWEFSINPEFLAVIPPMYPYFASVPSIDNAPLFVQFSIFPAVSDSPEIPPAKFPQLWLLEFFAVIFPVFVQLLTSKKFYLLFHRKIHWRLSYLKPAVLCCYNLLQFHNYMMWFLQHESLLLLDYMQ